MTKTNRIITMAVLLVIAASGPLFASGGQEPIDPVTLPGELVYLEGEVFLNGVPAQIGDVVNPGDRIVTGIDGLAEITFGPKNILQFREDTDAAIEPAWSGVELDTGIVGAVLNGLDRLGFGDDNRFKVSTETAVLGVRGTTFFISHPGDNEAYFCTCNGKLHLETPDGALARDTEAYQHQAVWYVRTPDGIRTYESGLNFHDNAMLDAIAEKANTTVLWRD